MAEGIALGAISHAYDIQLHGIVVQAVMATFAVFASMLFLYATRIVRVTQRFTRIIIGALMGIMVLFLGSLIASLFGVTLDFWNQPTPLGIGITLLIVGVAAFSLMIDFDFIESAVAAEAPRYMEWYGAFGLMVGLVFLYLNLLRLLALLRVASPQPGPASGPAVDGAGGSGSLASSRSLSAGPWKWSHHTAFTSALPTMMLPSRYR